MQEESYASQPLLYIEQGERGKILTNMQGQYFSSQSFGMELESDPLIQELDREENSIGEKIQDAIRASEHLPNIKYRIDTREDSHEGFIKGLEEDKLFIMDEGRGEERSIPTSSIQAIKAISL